MDVKFSTVALGAAHCLAISNGQLYTWGKWLYCGNNASLTNRWICSGKCHVGQLGHGEEFSDEYVPRLVEKPKDVKFVQVSSGDSHSLAITDQGELYVFGIGYYGALVRHNVSFFGNVSDLLLGPRVWVTRIHSDAVRILQDRGTARQRGSRRRVSHDWCARDLNEILSA